MTVTILNLDSRTAMSLCMAPGSVDAVITSPPYFGLRDYGHDGQIGLEPTPDEYVAAMVEVFREARRVLRDDGVVWLNIGDSYSGSGKGPAGNIDLGRSHDPRKMVDVTNTRHDSHLWGLKPKDLIGIPWRVAFALQADGWYLRQDIIWHKPNPMPESVTDRCTKAHEYIFMLTKSPRYYFDAEAVKEPAIGDTTRKVQSLGERSAGNIRQPGNTPVKDGSFGGDGSGKRNRRSVWTVTTKPYKGAHFATFPLDLIEPCVLASPVSKCGACGAPRIRQTAKTVVMTSGSGRAGNPPAGKYETDEQSLSGSYDIRMGPSVSVETLGWSASCACNAPDVPAVILDPFGGAGTTALAARKHGRDAILCELNAGYVALAEARLAES